MYSFSAYWLLGSILGAAEIAVNKIVGAPTLKDLIFYLAHRK